MADSESIPGLSISITADTGDLETKFNSAMQELVNNGKTYAEALQSAFENVNFRGMAESAAQSFGIVLQETDEMKQRVNDLQNALDSARTSAENYAGSVEDIMNRQRDANDALETSQKTLGEIQQLFDAGKASANDLARAAQEVQSAFDKANPSLEKAGQNAESAGASFGNLVTQALSLAGITVSIEALVELGKAAIDASDKLNDAAYAIGRLNKGAMDGKAEIAGLLAVAQDEGLSFPALVTAAQHLEVLGIHGQDTIDTLAKLGNAAELTGGSIDSMAQKFATMAEEGSNISARTLKTMGLTIDEVKQSMIDMGANADLVSGHWKELWKTMDETQHADVLKGALDNLDGAAKAMNDDIKGDVQRSMNEFYVTLGKLGDALAPLAQQTLPYLVDALKVLVTGVDAGATSLKVMIDLFGGWLGVLKDVYTGLGEAANALAHLDFSGAASAVSAAIDRVKTDMSDMSTKIQSDIKAGVDFGKQAWGVDMPDALDKTGAAAKDTSQELSGLSIKTKETADNIIPLLRATHDLHDELSAALDSTNNEAAALEALSIKVEKAGQSYANANALLLENLKTVDDVKQKYEDGAASIGDVEKAEGNVSKALDLVNKTFKDQEAALDALSKAYDVAGNAQRAYEEIATEGVVEAEKATAALKALGIIADTVPAKMSDINRAVADLGGSLKSVHPDAVQLETDLKNLANDDNTSWDEMTTRVENFDKQMSQLAKVDLPAATAAIGQSVTDLQKAGAPIDVINTQLGTFQKYIQQLAKTDLPDAVIQQGKYTDELIREQAPLGQILDSQAKQLQMQIRLAEETGTSASAQIIALDGIRLKQLELKDSADGWGTSVVASTKAIQGAFDSISKGFADIIVSGKNVGDVFSGIWKTFATQEINIFITQELKKLENAFLDLGNSAQKGAGQAKSALDSISKSASSAASGITSAGDSANATYDEFGNLADGTSDVSASMDKMSGGANAATSAFGSFAKSLKDLAPLLTAAWEAGKLLGTELYYLFSGPSNLNVTSNIPIAGLSGSDVDTLAKMLGINTQGDAALGTQANPTLNPSAAPTAESTAAAINSLKLEISRLGDLQTGLTNQMMQAYASGQYYLGDKFAADVDIVKSAIQKEQGILESIDGSTKEGAAASTHAAATTANMVDALGHATSALDNLHSQQAQLQNDILVAQAAGDDKLVAALESQLGTVNGSITTEQGILDGIRTSVGTIAPQILTGFDTWTAGIKLLSNPGNLDNAGYDKLQADIEALRVALQSGDIAAIAKATADLHAVIMQANESPAVVAALAEMQAALLSGNMADLEKATADLKSAEAGNSDKLVAAQKEMAAAIVSGNAADLAKATADLDAALTAASAKQEDAVIQGMTGLKASEGEVASAISNQQNTLDGLKAQQAQLNEDLKIAVAYGDDKLVAAIETQLSKVGGQITTASGILDQIKGDQQSGNADIVTGLSGVKASADDIKVATQNAQKSVDGLQAKLDDLKQQLILAEKDHNAALVDTLTKQIGTTNSDLTTANGLLTEIKNNTSAAQDLLKEGITGAKATGDQTASAVANLEADIKKNQAEATDLTERLKIALSQGLLGLATDITDALAIVNANISKDQALLDQIAPSITHSGQLTADEITGAIASEKAQISSLQDHLSDLNKQLTAAQKANQDDLVTTINKEIGDTNAKLKTANDLLDLLTKVDKSGAPISSGTGGTSPTTGSSGGSSGGTGGASPVANTPGQGLSAAQGGGYTPLQQPSSPYLSTGYANPSDEAANLNAGTIANSNRDNARMWAIYESAYHDYMLNIQGQGYMPPEARTFNIKVPNAMGPGEPDAQGIRWEVDTGKPLGPAEPSLPYKGPAQAPGSAPVYQAPPPPDTNSAPGGNGGSGTPTVETGGPGGTAIDFPGRIDNTGSGSGNIAPRGSIDRGPTTPPASGGGGRGGTYTPPEGGGTTPPPTTGTGGSYTPPPPGSGQTDWTPIISAISAVKASIDAIHTDTGKISDITTAVKAAATSADKLDSDTVAAFGTLQQSVDAAAAAATQSAGDLLSQITGAAQDISSIYATDTGIQSAIMSLQGDIAAIRSYSDGIFSEGNSIIAGVKDVDNSVQAAIAVLTPLGDAIAGIVPAIGAGSDAIVAAIGSLGDSLGGMADAISAAIASAGSGSGGATPDQGQVVTIQPVTSTTGPVPRVPTGNRIPSHAGGGYIENDELAVLHAGEVVLTAKQVQEIWSGAGPADKTPIQDPTFAGSGTYNAPTNKTPVQDPSVAYGPKDKTPIFDPDGSITKPIVDAIFEAAKVKQPTESFDAATIVATSSITPTETATSVPIETDPNTGISASAPETPIPTAWQPGKGSNFSGYNPYSTPTDTQGGYYGDMTRYDNTAKPAAAAAPSMPTAPKVATGPADKTPVKDPSMTPVVDAIFTSGSASAKKLTESFDAATVLIVASINSLEKATVKLQASIGPADKTPVKDPSGPANKTPILDPSFIPSFDVGGYVSHDTLAQIHAGEYVLTPDISSMLMDMARSSRGSSPSYPNPASGPGVQRGQPMVLQATANFYGVTNARQQAQMFTEHLKTVIPGASAYSS